MRELSHLENREGPGIAAFDADGVLWSGDVSEDFTAWMIDRGKFDAALMPRYAELHHADPAAACVMILEFYRGMAADQICDCVQEFWRTAPPRQWNRDAVQAVRWLIERDISVYIVSGSPSVVLADLHQHLPIEPDHILGVELEFDAENRATGNADGIVTHGPGKAQRLRQASPEPVLVAVGNSILDREMVALSEDVRWAVEPDTALRAIAERDGWLITTLPKMTP